MSPLQVGFAIFSQLQICLRRLLGLFNKAMQQNHPFTLYRKQDSSDTLIQPASDFPEAGIHFSHDWHPDRPPILNRLNIATDRLLVLFAQTLQPITNRLISRFRSVKNHLKRHIGIHARKRTIFGTACKLSIPPRKLEI
ncbi:hypothetical protein [Kineobactrum sediminis]|uniref:hypothetical protein n=1 Tax=Kineobactrum sediminis TaxID=1905677 RepID=UPI001F4EDE59|nr:hypothetical protein [Kineobactrum sediminis]